MVYVPEDKERSQGAGGFFVRTNKLSKARDASKSSFRTTVVVVLVLVIVVGVVGAKHCKKVFYILMKAYKGGVWVLLMKSLSKFRWNASLAINLFISKNIVGSALWYL